MLSISSLIRQKNYKLQIIYSRVLNELDGTDQLKSQLNPHKNGWLNSLAR
jgi:hypothetical protein